MYDLGGGTFDVSVVKIESGVVEVLATSGDNHLGGDDFDAIILDRINDHLETDAGLDGARDDRVLQARLRRAAEQAKVELSRLPYVRVEEDHVATVDGAVKHLSWEWSRTDFEGAIEELLAGTMRAVTTALNDAAVRPNELDRILLVGGSTRIPRVSQLLAERLGQEPHGEVNPELCVALGAGVQAGIEMGLDMPAVLVDITPYTFGTSILGELDGRPYAHQFVPLIRRNAKLPATHTEAFYTVYENQPSAEIKVYQGEDPDALQNVEIGTFLFEGLNSQQGSPRPRPAVHLPPGPGRHPERARRGARHRPRDPRRDRAGDRPLHGGGARRLDRADQRPLGGGDGAGRRCRRPGGRAGAAARTRRHAQAGRIGPGESPG